MASHSSFLENAYGYQFDKKIHIWIGLRQEFSTIIRKIPKSIYENLNSDSILYHPSIAVEDHIKPYPHGSYDLFHPSSNQFHLITEGSMDEEFCKALLAYCIIDTIMLPRAQGGGEAPVIKDRIPVVVFCESEEWILPVLNQHILVISISDLKN
jgi:hypothetical protein